MGNDRRVAAWYNNPNKPIGMKNNGNVHWRPEHTTPANGANQIPDWYKAKVYVWPLTAVHQDVVDIFTVHKFMKGNCKAAQLH